MSSGIPNLPPFRQASFRDDRVIPLRFPLRPFRLTHPVASVTLPPPIIHSSASLFFIPLQMTLKPLKNGKAFIALRVATTDSYPLMDEQTGEVKWKEKDNV